MCVRRRTFIHFARHRILLPFTALTCGPFVFFVDITCLCLGRCDRSVVVVVLVRVACDLSVRQSVSRSAMYCPVSTGLPRDFPVAATATPAAAAGKWQRRRWTGAGPGLSMLSRGREYHLAPGSSLSLDCEFYMEAFDAFHNPVIWVKSQSTPANGGAQRIKINVMGIIRYCDVH